MRHKKHIALFLALGTVSTSAMAVEITGGDFNLKYSQFDEEVFDETLDSSSVEAAIEFGFSPSFALQLDLGYYSFGFVDDNGTMVALHGIYNLNDEVSFGAFLGQDDIDVVDSDFYGFEAVYDAGKFEVEGYLGLADGEGDDAGLFGVYGAYGLSERLDITGRYEIADDDDVSLDVYEVGLKFEPVDDVAFTVGIGSADLDAFGESGSDTFFSVGLEFALGANKGAKFGQRGILQLVPGL